MLLTQLLQKQRYTTTNNTDVSDGDASLGIAALIAAPGPDGTISLREAIEAANQTSGHDEISFDSSLDGTTITLLDTNRELSITDSVTIDASMLSDGITIDAGHGTNSVPGDADGFRVFNINLSSGGDINLKGLTITGGDVTGAGGGIYLYNNGSDLALTFEDLTITDNHATFRGGGIYADVSEIVFTLKDSAITNNSADDGGGIAVAMFVEGQFVLEKTIITGNTALDRGGGIFTLNYDGTETLIEDSQITGNLASSGNGSGKGGGLYVYLWDESNGVNIPKFTISRSTVDNNDTEHEGGGIFVCAKSDGEFRALNTTISGNRTLNNTTLDSTKGRGGGLFIARYDLPDEKVDAFLTSVTITQNISQSGGGLEMANLLGVKTSIQNSIISENFDHQEAPNNLVGRVDIANSHYNLVGSGSSVLDLNGVPPMNGLDTTTNIQDDDDPNLSPLRDNGGPTLTHMPNCGSPALDAGDPQYSVGGGLFDQRGLDRVFDLPTVLFTGKGPIDIGAVELTLIDLQALAADFDQDGDVDGEDFLTWQQGFGSTVNVTQADGDANGDGIVDVVDLMAWSEQFGMNTNIDADFDSDGNIDGDDLIKWQEAFGINDGGDADGDGDTDGADFLAWQAQFSQSMDCHQWAADAIAFQEFQPGEIYVSTTRDEDDGNYSLGDMSLREAIKIANASPTPTTIVLPTGHYLLNLVGTEAGDASYNDLDITGDITIQGEGAGFSVIDSSGLTGSQGRIFGMTTSNGSLDVSFVTLTSGTAFLNGHGSAAYITAGASFTLSDSAVVNHNLLGSPIYVNGADITIRRSVFTNNVSEYAAAPAVGIFNSGTITIGESIFALNLGTYGTSTASVWVTGSSVVKVNEGYNLIENTSGGFFDLTPGTGDFVGTPGYVVTSMADTFDHADDDDALSLREAIDLANNDSAASEVWLPAWDFVLTRDRATYGGGSSTDIDVAFGDLDISAELKIRGVLGKTSVTWMPGVVDAIFDLLGDYAGDGITTSDDGLVSNSDYYFWAAQNGSTNGLYSADGDDDGDVDYDDLILWSMHHGNWLLITDVLV